MAFRAPSFLLIAASASGAGLARAETTCVRVQDGAAVACTTTSDAGKTMTLTFPNERITRASEIATFCATPPSAIDEAVLWMPEHDHGSGPTSLTRRDDGCTEIEGIDFLMLGHWQIKIHLPEDGDRGIFDVEIVR